MRKALAVPCLFAACLLGPTVLVPSLPQASELSSSLLHSNAASLAQIAEAAVAPHLLTNADVGVVAAETEAPSDSDETQSALVSTACLRWSSTASSTGRARLGAVVAPATSGRFSPRSSRGPPHLG